jgi:mannonate dehydratase
MRLALGAVRSTDPGMLRYARQIGYDEIVVNTPQDLPGDGVWLESDLRQMMQRIDEHGLTVAAIENTPLHFYRDIILGGPKAREQLELYKKSVKAVGSVGIPIMGFHWMANEVWRTSLDMEGRGGSRLTAFDYDLIDDPDAPTHGRVFQHDEIWRNFERFMSEVLPVAERYGVRMALHPDDPPVESLGGIARLFWNVDELRNVVRIFGDSAAFGLQFCLGTVSEMGPGAADALEEFVRREAVAYVHFRDVLGYMPRFHEAFLGEGNLDPVDVITRLVECEFQGFLIDDHVPLLDGDPEIAHDWVKSEYAFRGRAYANGFVQGMVKVLTHSVHT